MKSDLIIVTWSSSPALEKSKSRSEIKQECHPNMELNPIPRQPSTKERCVESQSLIYLSARSFLETINAHGATLSITNHADGRLQTLGSEKTNGWSVSNLQRWKIMILLYAFIMPLRIKVFHQVVFPLYYTFNVTGLNSAVEFSGVAAEGAALYIVHQAWDGRRLHLGDHMFLSFPPLRLVVPVAFEEKVRLFRMVWIILLILFCY